MFVERKVLSSVLTFVSCLYDMQKQAWLHYRYLFGVVFYSDISDLNSQVFRRQLRILETQILSWAILCRILNNFV